MTAKSQIILDRRTESICIKNLTVKDPEVFDVLSNQKEVERPEFVKRAVKVGTIALRDVVVAEKIDFVKREFALLCFELEKIFKRELGKEGMKGELEKVFGDEGKLHSCLEKLFGKDGKLVRDILDMNNKNSPIGQLRATIESYFVGKDSEIYNMLDPNSQDSPISRLKQELINKLDAIETTIETYLTRKEIISKTPQKGFDFEEVVENFLLYLSKPFGDKVERTGTERGKLGNLKGDFVITLHDPTFRGKPPRIVVEAKTTANTRLTTKSLLGELRDAIQNREASFAIAVTDTIISEAIGCYYEVEGDKIICSCGENGLPLEVAYRIARTYIILRSQEALKNAIDTSKINAIVCRISNDLSAVRGIKTELTKISTTSEKIAIEINSLERNIRLSLEELQAILSYDTKETDKVEHKKRKPNPD
ncbi:hypothetical protein HXY32_08450 [Candidatus Bathyarchaeota archaeon]|nr:hypothetical protein [Candidatus Bathyarchaeota archaeon]